jgi:hypothetical protein
MRTDLQAKANEVLKLTSKYSEGGSRSAVRKNLLRLRHEQLAHRQIAPSTVNGAEAVSTPTAKYLRLTTSKVCATARR